MSLKLNGETRLLISVKDKKINTKVLLITKVAPSEGKKSALDFVKKEIPCSLSKELRARLTPAFVELDQLNKDYNHEFERKVTLNDAYLMSNRYKTEEGKEFTYLSVYIKDLIILDDKVESIIKARESTKHDDEVKEGK